MFPSNPVSVVKVFVDNVGTVAYEFLVLARTRNSFLTIKPFFELFRFAIYICMTHICHVMGSILDIDEFAFYADIVCSAVSCPREDKKVIVKSCLVCGERFMALSTSMTHVNQICIVLCIRNQALFV